MKCKKSPYCRGKSCGCEEWVEKMRSTIAQDYCLEIEDLIRVATKEINEARFERGEMFKPFLAHSIVAYFKKQELKQSK